MAITNPQGIPASIRPDLEAFLVDVGPKVAPQQYPVDENGEPMSSLSNTELAWLFEHITRRYWRDEIKRFRSQKAEQEARELAESQFSSDPFDETEGV